MIRLKVIVNLQLLIKTLFIPAHHKKIHASMKGLNTERMIDEEAYRERMSNKLTN